MADNIIVTQSATYGCSCLIANGLLRREISVALLDGRRSAGRLLGVRRNHLDQIWVAIEVLDDLKNGNSRGVAGERAVYGAAYGQVLGIVDG